MLKEYLEKLTKRLSFKNEYKQQIYNKAQKKTDRIKDEQFITILISMIKNLNIFNLIFYTIIFFILITLNINTTSILPALLIATIPPITSLALSLGINKQRIKNKYKKSKSNTQQIIDEILATIKEEDQNIISILYENAAQDIDLLSTNIPIDEKEAKNKLNQLQTKLNFNLNWINTLIAKNIIYNRLITSINDISALINVSLYTIIIASPTIIYSIIMAIILCFFFPTLIPAKLTAIIFTSIIALGGIIGSHIANKIIDDEIEAYKELKLKLNLPNFDIKNYNPNPERHKKIIDSTLDTLIPVLTEIEFLKLKIEEFEKKPTSQIQKHFFEKVKHSPKPKTSNYEPTLIIGPKISKKRIPNKKNYN